MKGTKLKGPVWDHFVVVDPGKNALTSKVKCKYCPWEHLGHPAKMQAHLDRRCPGYGERAHLPVDSPKETVSMPSPRCQPIGSQEREGQALPCKKVKVESRGILNHFDRFFISSEQSCVVNMLALVCVKTATPYYAPESEEFWTFFASLRKDFA